MLKVGVELDAAVEDEVMALDLATGAVCFKELDVNEIPHYSTDIAAAWEVVEKLGEMDLSFAPDDREGTWDCSFGWDGSENNPTCVYAPTASEAICRSALLAVGAKLPVMLH